MSQDRRRVIWFEGMTLDPHHLQQWDRYQESMLTARLRAASAYEWGLTRLEVDRDALANGEFVLNRATGVLPDGYFFDLPQTDAAPPSRNLQEHFAPTEESLPVYLALPMENAGSGDFLLQGAQSRRETRFAADTATVTDANTGMDERQIEVARANLRLRFGRESLGAYSTIQIAEVTRNAAGSFALNDLFIPPCLNISGSERLVAIARRLVELLAAKSGSLQERQRSILAQRELSPADLAALGIAGAVNTYLPLLNHSFTSMQGHPEGLFMVMLALAGQLSTWVPHVTVQPRDYPSYNHAEPTESFGRLDMLLRELLGTAAPKSNYVSIRLERQRENLYAARIDQNLLEQAQLYLVARSDRLPEEVLVTEMPRMLRIASPSTIDAVLRSYTRALVVEHTNRLPSGMPVDGKANYFQVQQRGPFWESVVEGSAMSIFVPAEFSEVNLQLIAVNRP